jgi:hypothetical protein
MFSDSILKSTWGSVKNAVIGGLVAIGFGLLILFLSVFTVTNPQAATGAPSPIPTATDSAVKVQYYLPYPGILPDSPLYKLKVFRDRISLATSFNPEKRIAKELFLADKRINAAKALVDGGKPALGASTATKAEKYLEDAAKRAIARSNKGNDVKSLLMELSKASAKHLELMEQMRPNLAASDQLAVQKSMDTTQIVMETVNQALLEK